MTGAPNRHKTYLHVCSDHVSHSYDGYIFALASYIYTRSIDIYVSTPSLNVMLVNRLTPQLSFEA